MFRDYRYIFGFVIAFALLIVILILVFSNPSSNNTTISITKDYNFSSSVELTIQGPIVADSEHNFDQIIVNSGNVTFNLYKGYSGNNLISSKIFNNSPQSYFAFLNSLKLAGFEDVSNNPNLKNSSGYCSYGDVYDFKLTQDNKDVLNAWSTNCSSTPHTLLGDSNYIVQLFENQVPNYNTLVQNANF